MPRRWRRGCLRHRKPRAARHEARRGGGLLPQAADQRLGPGFLAPKILMPTSAGAVPRPRPRARGARRRPSGDRSLLVRRRAGAGAAGLPDAWAAARLPVGAGPGARAARRGDGVPLGSTLRARALAIAVLQAQARPHGTEGAARPQEADRSLPHVESRRVLRAGVPRPGCPRSVPRHIPAIGADSCAGSTDRRSPPGSSALRSAPPSDRAGLRGVGALGRPGLSTPRRSASPRISSAGSGRRCRKRRACASTAARATACARFPRRTHPLAADADPHRERAGDGKPLGGTEQLLSTLHRVRQLPGSLSGGRAHLPLYAALERRAGAMDEARRERHLGHPEANCGTRTD